MYKKSLLAILTFVLSASHAWAADEQGHWIAIAASSSVAYSAKGESGGLMNVSGKKGNAYGYVYQIENKKNKTFSYGKVFVMLDACKKGYGQVIYNDMQGKFTDAIDFVRFGGTVADSLGSVACSAWDGETGKISRAETAGRWELAAKATESGNEFVLKTRVSGILWAGHNMRENDHGDARETQEAINCGPGGRPYSPIPEAA
ncbi:hypothetical protein [Castellaniella sp.]|uniref:hypothetical protein n=1 Tax=Castellaniella sp. TaxID=1955812 RepID=UPI003A93FFEA